MAVKDVKDAADHVKAVLEVFLSDNSILTDEGRRLPSFAYRRLK